MIGIDFSNGFPLFGHSSQWISGIHLTSAGVFLFCMGWMSINRFTKGNTTKYHWYYKLSGRIVWICIAILALEFLLNKLLGNHISFGNYDVFIFETIAVFFFGSSWLIKGKAIEDIKGLKNRILIKLKKE